MLVAFANLKEEAENIIPLVSAPIPQLLLNLIFLLLKLSSNIKLLVPLPKTLILPLTVNLLVMLVSVPIPTLPERFSPCNIKFWSYPTFCLIVCILAPVVDVGALISY